MPLANQGYHPQHRLHIAFPNAQNPALPFNGRANRSEACFQQALFRLAPGLKPNGTKISPKLCLVSSSLVPRLRLGTDFERLCLSSSLWRQSLPVWVPSPESGNQSGQGLHLNLVPFGLKPGAAFRANEGSCPPFASGIL
jgi:hypothetical protein